MKHSIEFLQLKVRVITLGLLELMTMLVYLEDRLIKFRLRLLRNEESALRGGFLIILY